MSARRPAMAAFGSSGFGLVVRERPLSLWWRVAEDLTVDLHRLRVLSGFGVFAGLLEQRGLAGLRAHVLDAGDVGIVGIDRAEAIDIRAGQGAVAAELGGAGEASERFYVIRVGEKNLLPGLRGHIHAAANLEGAGFVEE